MINKQKIEKKEGQIKRAERAERDKNIAEEVRTLFIRSEEIARKKREFEEKERELEEMRVRLRQEKHDIEKEEETLTSKKRQLVQIKQEPDSEGEEKLF